MTLHRSLGWVVLVSAVTHTTGCTDSPSILDLPPRSNEPLAAGPSASYGTESREPCALYGGGPWWGSRTREKCVHVRDVGKPLEDVQYIDVLELGPFTGGGGTYFTPCSPYVPPEGQYAYCLLNTNDGAGNRVKLGIVECGTLTLSATRETLSNAVAGDENSCVTLTLKSDRDTISNVGVGDDPYTQLYSTVELTVTTEPPTSGLTIEFVLRNSFPPHAGMGYFLSASNSATNIADDLGGGRYQLRYVAKAETEDDKCEHNVQLWEQTITVEALGPGNAHAETELWILSRFNFLVKHSSYPTAIEYVRRKYRITFPFHSTVSFDGTLTENTWAVTSLDDHVYVSRSAFASENRLASSLLHELVHVGESRETQRRAGEGKKLYADIEARQARGEAVPPISQEGKNFIREWAQVELRAYRKQLADAGFTCLNDEDRQSVQSLIENFQRVERAFPAGRNTPPRGQPSRQDPVPPGQARPTGRKSHGLSDH